MRALIDSGILLDVALARRPFLANSLKVLQWAEDHGEAAIVWHSITNCAYLLEKNGREFLRGLLEIVEVVPTGKASALTGLKLPMKDLEDALQAVAAEEWKAQWIITRNTRDYRHSPVAAISARQFVQRYL